MNIFTEYPVCVKHCSNDCESYWVREKKEIPFSGMQSIAEPCKID